MRSPEPSRETAPAARAFSMRSASPLGVAAGGRVQLQQRDVSATSPISSTPSSAIQPRPRTRRSTTGESRSRARSRGAAVRDRRARAAAAGRRRGSAGAVAATRAGADARGRRRAGGRASCARARAAARWAGGRPRPCGARRSAAGSGRRRSPSSSRSLARRAAARVRPRVVRDLLRRRRDGAAREQLGLGLAPADADGSSGGQMQPRARSAKKRLTRRSSSEWKEIAAIRPPGRSSSQASGSARSSEPISSLTAIRIAWKTRARRMPAGELGRRRHGALDRRDQLGGGLDRRALARGGRSRARCGARSAPRRSRGKRPRAALGPLVHDRARVELLRRVHPHVERRVVGIGEAALARVDLQRGDPEVHIERGPPRGPRRRARAARRRSCPRMKRVAQATSAAKAAKCSSACGSRSMQISSPAAPIRSATRRAWPPAPNVQSIAICAGRRVEQRRSARRREQGRALRHVKKKCHLLLRTGRHRTGGAPAPAPPGRVAPPPARQRARSQTSIESRLPISTTSRERPACVDQRLRQHDAAGGVELGVERARV